MKNPIFLTNQEQMAPKLAKYPEEKRSADSWQYSPLALLLIHYVEYICRLKSAAPADPNPNVLVHDLPCLALLITEPK